MSSIAFARQLRTTGYGHDTLFSYGATANGETIDFTADRIASLKLTWIQASTEVTAEVGESATPFRREDLLAAADAVGISTGVLRASRGTAQLFRPIIDHPATATAATIDAVSKLGENSLPSDMAGKILANALDRPTGAHLRGGNVVNGDGTLRSALEVPRLVVVQVFAPGERRAVTGDPVPESAVAALEKAHTIDELIKASEPVIEDLGTREALVSDLLEMREDLPPHPGLLPGADNGVVVPFECTDLGFTKATTFAVQLQEIIPDITVSVGRTWKRV